MPATSKSAPRGKAGPRESRPPAKRGATKSKSAPAPDSLTEADIVKAARKTIAEVGVDGLTMRSLSETLGVALGATYHHVPTKHALLVLVGRSLYGDVADASKVGGWDVRLKKAMASQAALIRRHTGMASFMIGAVEEIQPTELAAPIRELLVEAGFSERSATALLANLYFYVVGSAAAGSGKPFGGRGAGAVFEEGLDLLIEGAQARLASEGTKRKPNSAARR